jgi:hypothetical protein
MPEAPWKPSRPTVAVIGLLSLWPVVYMFLFMASFAWIFATFHNQGQRANEIPLLFKIIFPLHLLTMLLMFILMAVFVVHAYRTDRIENDKRVLWVVILFFGNMVAFPVYWYLYMWRAPAPAAGPAE